MDREKIGHDQDQELLQLLVSETENALERIKEVIETKDYFEGEIIAVDMLGKVQQLQKQFGIMPMRGKSARTLKAATDEEITQLEELNDILALANDEILDITSKVSNSLLDLNNSDSSTTLEELKVNMAATVGENDFAYREEEFFIHFDDLFLLAGSEQFINNDNPFWGNGLDRFRHCDFFHELYNYSMPPLWLEDILRIDTIVFDMVFTIRKTVKIPKKDS